MSFIKCDNCGNSFPENEIENHKLYCVFSIQQKELENLIPCEICNQLIDFNVYHQHLLYCPPIPTSTPAPTFTSLNFPELNRNESPQEPSDVILSNIRENSRNMLGILREMDDIINRIRGVEADDTYDDLINLEQNNVNVGVKKVEDYVTKKQEIITCPICTMETEEIGETVCGHKFCYECIEEWLKNNKKCPVCMIEFNDN
jgi:hypothetical protein